MRFYHTTTKGNAEAILKEGFKDQKGTFGTSLSHRGIWIADRIMDVNESVPGDVVFTFNIPVRIVSPFEWIEEGKPYREFLVPAKILNAYQKTMKYLWKA